MTTSFKKAARNHKPLIPLNYFSVGLQTKKNMKNLILTIAALSIGGCANTEGYSNSSSTVEAASYTAITDQTEFNSLIVDRTLVKGSSTTWIVNSDGSLGGSVFGEAVSGTWVWEGAYCRKASFEYTTLSYGWKISG